MKCQKIQGAIICTSSEGDYSVIDRTGKLWHFDFSERFGPLLLTPENKQIAKKQPDDGPLFKQFWFAFNRWNKKRLAKIGAKP